MSVDSRHGPFPLTHPSLVRLAADPSAPGWRTAWERFFADYWRPLYAFLRRTGSGSQEALDLLQDFFLAGLDGRLLTAWAPDRGRLRTYLLACLNHHRQKAWRRERARPERPCPWLGGEAPPGEVEPAGDDPAETYERDWDRCLQERALESVRARLAEEADATGRRLLEEWVLSRQRPPVEELAGDLGLSTAALYTRASRLRQTLADEVERRLRWLQTDPEVLARERDDVLRLLRGERA